ncbi:hypothetical protein GCM10017786_21840 [Amycolatopsis deserti]|uniref:Uncharacterized protein n=1 Tax=Amycolatopsis deserti TaxID=185696 RepID=A0ABQ3IQL3_9PSEU|nr:hypothetical protein [Amycolatopsis deserti]GHE89348.1 hypothetical protein GCM10017786_21840 [Amycolatopsis deserti]
MAGLVRQIGTIALYWLTGTGASTARWFWEALRWVPRSAAEENTRPATVPALGRAGPAPRRAHLAVRVADRRLVPARPARSAPARSAYEGAGNPQLSDYRAVVEPSERPGWHGARVGSAACSASPVAMVCMKR